MATIKEILEIEDSNGGSIHLHKEGVFWKAYQKSAFLVHKIEPAFRVKKTFVKVVNAEIASLGFPDGALKRLFSEAEIEKVNEKLLRIKSEAVAQADYEAWFNELALEQLKGNEVASAMATLPHVGCDANVLKQLREFRLESATPIECMCFLTTLRKELKGNGDI